MDMVNTSIMWEDVISMINHWSTTPENRYLGSDYGGAIVISNYVEASNEDNANILILKLKKDIPYLKAFNVSVELKSMCSIQFSVGSDSTIILIKNSNI